MRKWGWRLPFALAACGLIASAPVAGTGKKEKVREEVAIIDTNLGRITFRFFHQESPKAIEAFKQLARSGFYNGIQFHKVMPGLLIQAGDPRTRDTTAPQVEAAPLDIEKSALKHHPGTVSMVHDPNDPRSRSEFFICLQEVSYFDGRHTIIGEVISNLKVVGAISNVPRDMKQAPLFPVRIRRLTVEVQEYFREK